MYYDDLPLSAKADIIGAWVEPLGDFLSPLKATFKTTRIARPGTQNKPYANKEQR